MGHPSPAVLKRFSAGTASREEAATIMAHLLGGCPSCAQQLRELSRPKTIGPGAYDSVFSRLPAIAAVPGFSKAGKAGAELLLKELLDQPEARQEMLVRNGQRYLSRELAKLLSERSFSARYEDTHKMLHFARLADCLSRRLEDCGDIANLRVLCLVQLSNALRVSRVLDEAERQLGEAKIWLRKGSGDPTPRVLYLECMGSLRTLQHRYEEARYFYDEAVSILRDLRKPKSLARALIGQAIAVGYTGEVEKALALLVEAMPKVDSADQRLTLAACHAVVHLQIEIGKIEEASLGWLDLRTLYQKIGDARLLIQGQWLEGRLLTAQGLLSSGLRLLKDVRMRYQRLGCDVDAAFVSLDIGKIYFRLGKCEDLRCLLTETLPVFRVHEFGGQFMVTLLQLKAALALRTGLSIRPGASAAE